VRGYGPKNVIRIARLVVFGIKHVLLNGIRSKALSRKQSSCGAKKSEKGENCGRGHVAPVE
jgi:hypothetical protein